MCVEVLPTVQNIHISVSDQYPLYDFEMIVPGNHVNA